MKDRSHNGLSERNDNVTTRRTRRSQAILHPDAGSEVIRRAGSHLEESDSFGIPQIGVISDRIIPKLRFSEPERHAESPAPNRVRFF